MLCKNVLNKFNYVVNGKTLVNSLLFKTTSIKGIQFWCTLYDEAYDNHNIMI